MTLFRRGQSIFQRLWPDHGRRWWHRALLPLSIPFGILWTIILIPLMLMSDSAELLDDLSRYFARSRQRRQEEREFQHAILRMRRAAEWPRLAPRLQRGEGTLIVEIANDGPGHPLPDRFWFTTEDVLTQRPPDLLPPPPPDQLDLQGRYPPHPFVVWCHQRYLDQRTGLANWLPPPHLPHEARIMLPWGVVDPLLRHLRSRFPRIRTLILPRCRHRCGHCDYDLRASSHRCPECGTPIPITDDPLNPIRTTGA